MSRFSHKRSASIYAGVGAAAFPSALGSFHIEGQFLNQEEQQPKLKPPRIPSWGAEVGYNLKSFANTTFHKH